MGMAKDVYDKMLVNEEKTIVMSTDMAAGSGKNSYEPYEKFNAEISVLETMASAGLVKIILNHKESSTGHGYVDLVRFRKLQ